MIRATKVKESHRAVRWRIQGLSQEMQPGTFLSTI